MNDDIETKIQAAVHDPQNVGEMSVQMPLDCW